MNNNVRKYISWKSGTCSEINLVKEINLWKDLLYSHRDLSTNLLRLYCVDGVLYAYGLHVHEHVVWRLNVNSCV